MDFSLRNPSVAQTELQVYIYLHAPGRLTLQISRQITLWHSKMGGASYIGSYHTR